ncbi:hypothetical protein TVAG_486530 [Trichomonas vaginalis G3]|uniref:Uncharacterized protein n=1 Tax=Trichomonas vaginalis (strain ATCC PRA-98 / G3) TaxID=412133 RepID=A2GBD2_TRIV3|nr:hypothetical protein TVAGG3_1007110 [Trichomonas vaginalis G3]EAX85536.1 hypothetical protein TVAG_486530 [Trichomonas vaginalis G3]KAI5491212.1 hypothetical protein TVAGG3_1007110 [Trichomonas vaginalis G3]|eukprot:XP_001298466.1 hypothetical protein [Trichomonas vaginalis G3]
MDVTQYKSDFVKYIDEFFNSDESKNSSIKELKSKKQDLFYYQSKKLAKSDKRNAEMIRNKRVLLSNYISASTEKLTPQDEYYQTRVEREILLGQIFGEEKEKIKSAKQDYQAQRKVMADKIEVLKLQYNTLVSDNKRIEAELQHYHRVKSEFDVFKTNKKLTEEEKQKRN